MPVIISSSDIHRLAQIVREETGNQVQEKNFPMLESRMKSHLLKKGISKIEEYWAYFQQHEKTEREELRNLMTTHYTFFFREFAHFEVLESWINKELVHLKDRYHKTKQPLRVWSAACSRGQEVYSLAIFLDMHLLKKHGVPFEVLGTDIDSESIAHATNGVYPLQEVSTIPLIYLNSYWKKGTGPIKDFAAIQPGVKARTKFMTLNFFNLSSWESSEKFDVIFCRNAFIYFSEENIKQIALNLKKRLIDRGLFVSGMSEPLRFSGWDMESVGPSCYQNLPLDSLKKKSSLKSHSTNQEKSLLPVEPSPSIHSMAPIYSPNPYRVLCVDDSLTIQLLIKKIFLSDPLCKGVDVAGNGKEACTQLNSNKYDLITLDIHMPEMNGIDFLSQHYDKKNHPPVIMISSVNRADMDLAIKSISLGAFDYIEKPAMNHLEKSTEEILTKAKMALRSKSLSSSNLEKERGFDFSIGKKIVVPDASQSLRLILADSRSRNQLEQVLKGQQMEHRSPPLVIVWKETALVSLESDLLRWTENQVIRLRKHSSHLRPNFIYLICLDELQSLLNHLVFQSVSLQILTSEVEAMSVLSKKIPTLQVLLDESLSNQLSTVEKKLDLKISDVTPSTSFPSLSLEFFASIRKVAA